MKISAPEVMMSSSEAISPEAVFIRRSEDHQKLKELKLQRLFK